MIVDFHIHVLPGVDHGSKDMDETIAMLTDAASSGVNAVVATHHFYPNRITLDEFTNKRDFAYDELVRVLPSFLNTIRVIKGAEVLLAPGLENMPELKSLCIEGTSFILLEMPYEFWTEWVFQSVFTMISARGLIPILAHIERYINFQKKSSNLTRLLQMDVLVQMNVCNICNLSTRRAALKMLRNNKVYVLGSDRHSSTKDKYEMKKARKIIAKNLGESWLIKLDRNSERILSDEMPEN